MGKKKKKHKEDGYKKRKHDCGDDWDDWEDWEDWNEDDDCQKDSRKDKNYGRDDEKREDDRDSSYENNRRSGHRRFSWI